MVGDKRGSLLRDLHCLSNGPRGSPANSTQTKRDTRWMIAQRLFTGVQGHIRSMAFLPGQSNRISTWLISCSGWGMTVPHRGRAGTKLVVVRLSVSRAQRISAILDKRTSYSTTGHKRLKLLTPKQKVVALMGNESLYFLRSGRYSPTTRHAIIRALQAYDALICIGQMQTKLAQDLLRETPISPRILTAESAIPSHRVQSLCQGDPCLDSRNLVFIGNGPSGWKGWYKGMDLLLDGVSQAESDLQGLSLTVVGDWDKSYIRSVISEITIQRTRSPFCWASKDLIPPLSHSALYIHLGRGEAWGISILEAMCAGVPAIVS